jgi:hypothetical protein
MKIEVTYHPEPDLARTYLHNREAGTVGIKCTDDIGQFGTWDFLPHPHTEQDVFRLLAKLATSLANALEGQYDE